RQIVFTSGGTESNNAAIAGAMNALPTRRRIVTTAIEHSSILAPLDAQEANGREVARVMPDTDGLVAPDLLISALDRDTALVSVGLVNGEVGAIQDVAALGREAATVGALFHIDAAQALGRLGLDAGKLDCDLMTLSGHKVGAPAGIGALYVRDPARVTPMLLGGPQESAMRAGTQNLLGAVAFGAAVEAATCDIDGETTRLRALCGQFFAELSASIPGLRVNGTRDRRVANTLNLTFPAVLGETILIALDLEGVEVSMGSACAAGSVEPSHVLLAMGRSAIDALSSLRVSLGWNTTADEIAAAAEIIVRVWRRVSTAEPRSLAAEFLA
ncbi:MAG: cysteine desulfurase family protein, partial [Candidatus Binataceae bacterium]